MYVTYLLDRSEMRSFTKNVQIKKKNIQNTRFGIQSDNEKLCNNLLNMCVHIFQIIFW